MNGPEAGIGLAFDQAMGAGDTDIGAHAFGDPAIHFGNGGIQGNGADADTENGNLRGSAGKPLDVAAQGLHPS